MALFEFLSNLDTTTLFLLLIIFILFVVSMKKSFSLVVNGAWVAVAAVLFPIAMNRFLGFNIPMDPDSLISFMIVGLGVYFIYLIGKSIYRVLGVAERAMKKVPTPDINLHRDTPKDSGPSKEEKKWQKQKERELEEKEKDLAKREQQIRFMSAVNQRSKPVKAKKNWDEDYTKLTEKPKKSSAVMPLPVIEHKKKKKRKED